MLVYQRAETTGTRANMKVRSIINRNATTTTNMRSILDAIRGYVPLFAPGRQLANSALHQLTEGWKGLGSPGLNQGQHPARTSAPYKAEEGSESRAPSGRRHRWKATPRRLGHPTRAIYHRHVMRVLIWSSQRSTTRHNGSDATAQFQLVRGRLTFSHGHSQSCAQVQGKGGEMD